MIYSHRVNRMKEARSMTDGELGARSVTGSICQMADDDMNSIKTLT